MNYGLVFQQISYPSALGTTSAGITSSGVIYGTYGGSVGPYYKYDGSQYNQIDTSFARLSPSLYLNDTGVIAGTSVDGVGNGQSYYSVNGVVYEFDAPNASFSSTEVTGLNKFGQIIGIYFDKSNNIHGFIDTNGSFTEVFVPGSTSTRALGISDSGVITGSYLDSGGKTHGFVEINGTYTDVTYPGSTFTIATGVDAAGNVFGSYKDANQVTHGFIDRAGAFSTFDFPGASSTSVTGVNSSGKIVGNADFHGYSLSFVPAVFGPVTTDPHSVGGQVYALYDGILGRAPDTLGLEYYADQISHGLAPASLAANFLASPEGQARLGAADNTAFIQQLYQNTLHRNADSAGLQFHLNELAHGVSRVDVADNFVFSSEHLSNLQPTLNLGLFVPDAQAAQVARVYYTMLGRAPDAGGLAYYTDQLDHGGTVASIAQGFLNSPENQATYGKLSNSAYVDALYVNALGRHAEASGLSYWTDQLNHGASRTDLAVQLSQSAESQNFHLAQIEQGWHLS